MTDQIKHIRSGKKNYSQTAYLVKTNIKNILFNFNKKYNYKKKKLLEKAQED